MRSDCFVIVTLYLLGCGQALLPIGIVGDQDTPFFSSFASAHRWLYYRCRRRTQWWTCTFLRTLVLAFCFVERSPKSSSPSVGQPADSEAEIATLKAYTDEENELLRSVNKKLKAGSCFARALPEICAPRPFRIWLWPGQNFYAKKCKLCALSSEQAVLPFWL